MTSYVFVFKDIHINMHIFLKGYRVMTKWNLEYRYGLVKRYGM